MALRQYKSKRNFGDTTEPEGKVKRMKSEELIDRIRKVFVEVKYFLEDGIDPIKNGVVENLSSEIGHSGLFFFGAYG